MYFCREKALIKSTFSSHNLPAHVHNNRKATMEIVAFPFPLQIHATSWLHYYFHNSPNLMKSPYSTIFGFLFRFNLYRNHPLIGANIQREVAFQGLPDMLHLKTCWLKPSPLFKIINSFVSYRVIILIILFQA